MSLKILFTATAAALLAISAACTGSAPSTRGSDSRTINRDAGAMNRDKEKPPPGAAPGSGTDSWESGMDASPGAK